MCIRKAFGQAAGASCAEALNDDGARRLAENRALVYEL